MSANALTVAPDASSRKAMRIPSLPGRQTGAPQIDSESSAYKAGYNAALAGTRADAAEREARHEEFARSIGAMLAEMDARYRKECLSLLERLFAAVAPSLAMRSSLCDIMHLVEERALRGHSELALRAHPSLLAHLPEMDQRKLNASPLVTLKTDETCAPAMVDAEWRKGGMFHDPDGLIKEILQALNKETAPRKEAGDE